MTDVEHPFFFAAGERTLFGFYHPPAVPSSLPALVFCHAFAEEKLWAQRIFVAAAREMAAAGYPVLRFDFSGNGDSEGDFAGTSVTGALDEIRSAIAAARRLSGRDEISLLGLRLGATFAALAADADPGAVHDLVLWAPVCDGNRYMQDLLRVNLTTQVAVHKEVRYDRGQLVEQMQQGGTVNVDGYEIAHPLFSQISAISLGGSPARYPGRCLIVQVDRAAGARPALDLQRLSTAYADATLTAVADDPFWKEIPRFCQDAPGLTRATLEWLRPR